MAKAPRDIQKRVAELRREILKHHELYHREEAPVISDEAYDSLLRELQQLEEAYPELKSNVTPTEAVGARPSEAFSKVRHRVRQWSFDNVFTHDELIAWEERLYRYLQKEGVSDAKLAYVSEHKIDGVKVILEYEKGKLIRAATRGDGVVGEDITHAAETITAIPNVLKKPVSVIAVGEAWLSEKEFTRINAEREKKNEPLFANPRNAAAGSLRQLDAAITASRKLSFITYDIDYLGEEGLKRSAPKTQEDELALLGELGFTTNKYSKRCKNLGEVEAFYKKWAPKKYEMPYGMDGVVVKVDDIELQKTLGYTAKSPRFGIAYKFPSEQATTVIEDIQLQVGRTGVLTPVAHLRPVLIAGSTVSRATLHNEDQINRLDVRVGDTVVLQKAGDIIPEILSVIKELRPKDAKPYAFPKKVPECGGDGSIERIPGTAAYRCVAKNSDTLHRRRLYYFVSKSALNMDGIGPKIIDLLLEHNLINTVADLYTLTSGDLEGLPSFKQKAAENVIRAIDAARTVPLHRLLVGLSIDHVGEETARLIAERMGSIEAVERADLEELAAIHGVGEIVAASVFAWMRDTDNQKLLKELQKHITIEALQVSSQGGKLSGKTLVFTGTLPTLKRTEAEEMARSEGARIASSVSKNTDYVVAGSDPGTKAEKAESLGVKILDEEGFKDLLS